MKRTALTCLIIAAMIAPNALAQTINTDPAARLEQARAALAKAQSDLAQFEREAKEEAERKQRAAAAARVAAEARAKAQALQQQRDREQTEALARANRAAQSLDESEGFVMEPSTPVPVVTITPARKYDPLRLKVVMRFPANVKTIQQATQYILETVNYKLTLSPLKPEETRMILSRPLLPQDRDGSLKTIEDGLLQISGDDTVLIIDRANKLISFESDKTRK